MCGIGGFAGLDRSPEESRAILDRMNRAQAHRGPDGEGVWLGSSVGLAHRRLSIIDLSDAGRQPMSNEDGSLILVANGEIYNYQALRADLLRRGHRFSSASDSETILHLYEEFGERCVTMLTGMFAFGLWDVRQQRLLLARDRIGEKPLHYAMIEDGIAFASEPKALLTLPGVSSKIDEEAVVSFLVYHHPPAPLTYFKDIRALEPASLMVWTKGSIRTERYWKLDFSAARHRWGWDEATARYDELLSESVGGCLLSDAPVGVYLSGGVDSSSIAAKAAETVPGIPTFCIGRDRDGAPDPEFQRAVAVAEHLGVPHTNLQFNPADITKLPKALSYYDQPFYQLRVLLDEQLATAARSSVKVALTGAGADEVFAGYAHYHNVRFASTFGRTAGIVPTAIIDLLGSTADKWRTFARVAKHPMLRWKGAMLDDEKDALARRLFTPAFYRRSREVSPGAIADRVCAECSPRNYLDATLYFQLMVFNQHGTTVLSDIAGMSRGLEVRAPFLNHRMVEFAASLPQSFLVPSLFSGKNNKAIMKRWLSRRLPADLVYAKKVGFGYSMTYSELLSGPWRKAAQLTAANGQYLTLGMFSPDAARAAVAAGGFEAFRLMIFSIWADMYLFGDAPQTIAEKLRRVTEESTA